MVNSNGLSLSFNSPRAWSSGAPQISASTAFFSVGMRRSEALYGKKTSSFTPG